MRKVKITFIIEDDGNGFNLKLKKNKRMKMGYIEGIASYTQNMVDTYKKNIKKENREQRRANK